MTESWLELLLAGASAETISAHSDDLVRGGADPVAAERQAGAALRLLARLDERRRRAAELAALNDIAARLAGLHQPDELLQEITAQARRLLGADLAYIGLVHGDDFVMEVASGAVTPQLRGLRVPRDAGMLGAVLSRGAPVWTSDYATEPAFAHDSFDATATAERFRALLGVPLAARGRQLGALFVCKRRESHFAEEEITLLSALASHAALALDNAAAIERHQTAAEQLTAVNARLERALAWEQQLTAVVLRGGGVEELVDEIAAAATGEVRFVDAGDAVPADLVARVPELPSVLAALFNDPPDACRAVPADGGTVRITAVIARQVTVGALVLLGGEDTETDRSLLERAAPALALAVVGERAVTEATRLARDALLLDLLHRPEPDPAVLRQRMRNAGLDPSAGYCLVSAEPGQGQPGEPQRRARRELAALGPPAGTIVAADGARLVAVVPARDPEQLVRAWGAGGALPSATIGVAGPTTGPADLHRCYREAVRTVDALRTLGRTGVAATAARLGIYRVLLSHAGRAELQAQFDALLGDVVREQERRSMPMLATLKTYLDHGCRAAPAAKSLGVHVNTLYQRLAVLDGLLGSTWREPPRALDLQFLLRVHPDAEPW
ncbi:GAF domain-containing protein [Streptomyces sp. NPDC048644]|uniref:helix-turn-helix domain-containing protein n=1 Tax=Streptomyces sp. NPDC048644 TaxID=3365582 RepID=UPI0037163C76